MVRSLGDILVVADMDGTLLDENLDIPRCNIENIRLFTQLGGHFTVGTGRIPESIGQYPELVELLSPAIACGGCMLYDFARHRTAKSHVLPRAVAQRALGDILKRFPRLGSAIVSENGQKYQITAAPELHGLFEDEHLSYLLRPAEDLPKHWVKLLFAGPEELLEKVNRFTAEQAYPGTYFVSTHPLYYEMMPEGASKGNAMLELCAMLGIERENTFVVGDYYNDVDMMQKAGHAVAMGNAPADVQMLAHEVTASNREAGVGQYLYRLIKEYE